MATTEPARHKLYQRLEDTLGPDEADTLMAHLPAVEWSQVATKDDLHQLEARLTTRFQSELRAGMGDLRAEMGELRGEMGELRGDLRSEMGDLRSEMGELRTEMRTGTADLRTELHHTLRVHAFLTVGATSAIVTAMVGALTL